MNQLIHFDKAKRELALATRIDEVKPIVNKAGKIAAYLKQSGECVEMQNQVMEMKIRGERRGGEIFKEIEREEGGRPKNSDQHEPSSLQQTEKESGVNSSTRKRWEATADIPEEIFEEHIATIKDKGEELTSIGTQRLAKQLKQTDQTEIESPPLPENKYHTIVIDPSWPTKKILREVRPNQDVFDYPPMTIQQIKEFPIQEITAENCHIYLWTTHKFLPDALDILKVWEFKYQCLLTWIKNVGMTPFSWMYSTEHCLFGRKGNLDLLKKGVRLDFSGKVREHSRKPDEFYNKIKLVSPEPRIDVFSREKREGFEQYGNEKDKFSN